ncbi:MAG: hypothetical protein HRU06_04455 [Oceanospirillaceae bacterium]|nr:hypothetical protein [Oceanospirillaceae bacterium]
MPLLKSKQLFFYLSVFIAGAIFAIGLQVAAMVDPNKVKGFLDITGAWDPSLALVLFSALVVFTVGFKLLIAPKIAQNDSPILSDTFCLPTRKDLDKPLIVGAILFGAGWGISGLCPGPTIVNLVHFDAKIMLFFVVMLLAMKLTGFIKR